MRLLARATVAGQIAGAPKRKTSAETWFRSRRAATGRPRRAGGSRPGPPRDAGRGALAPIHRSPGRFVRARRDRAGTGDEAIDDQALHRRQGSSGGRARCGEGGRAAYPAPNRHLTSPVTIQPHVSAPVPSRPSRSLPGLVPCDGHGRRLSPGASPARRPHVRPPSAVASPVSSVSDGATVGTTAPRSRPNLIACREPLRFYRRWRRPLRPRGLELTTDVVASGLNAPADVTSAGDGSGRLFVVEQAGRIRIVDDGALRRRRRSSTSRERIASGGERGLLGLAFHPDYPTDPRFFVDYTDVDGNTVVSEFTRPAATPNRADPASERDPAPRRPAVREPQRRRRRVRPRRDAVHRAGRRRRRRRPAGQRPEPRHAARPRSCASTSTRPGRRQRRTRVPPDNPFVGRTGAAPEIWLYGLRNPWRFAFDRATGDLWIGDVGQGALGGGRRRAGRATAA